MYSLFSWDLYRNNDPKQTDNEYLTHIIGQLVVLAFLVVIKLIFTL